jgi:hypothetical protein
MKLSVQLLPFLFLAGCAVTYAVDPGVPAADSKIGQASDDMFILEDERAPVHPEAGKAQSTVSPGKSKGLVEVDVTGKGPTQIFRLGNETYEKDQFEEAIAYYQAVVDRGVRNGDLYFNLANAYFRTGDFGHAVLFYEKAKRLRPRDPDIAHNLDYARTFLIDKEIKSDRLPGSLETLLILHRQTTLNETLWFLAFLSVCFAAMLIFKTLRLRFTEKVLFGYLRGVVFVLLLLQVVSTGFKVWIEEPQREGVILTDSVNATSAPNSDQQLLELNSGTRVQILDIRNGYAHIRLPNGVPAFIHDEDIGEV